MLPLGSTNDSSSAFEDRDDSGTEWMPKLSVYWNDFFLSMSSPPDTYESQSSEPA